VLSFEPGSRDGSAPNSRGRLPLEVDTYATTTPANGVILAAAATMTASLIGSYDPAIDELGHIESASAAMVTFSIPRANVTLPDRGTGYSSPRHAVVGRRFDDGDGVTFLIAMAASTTRRRRVASGARRRSDDAR